ncbi:YodD family peroxide/acid resistance protein [Biostraticola tofi]|uniref:Uncharacterized protein DUF2525 n=1 Tax=Biostraticola tofi TaxID=466109 RepID=A0A4V6P4A3_9GAMM|nr:YodD family peroxide/acid resistance protein [Biostraticola tofi]TCW00066.1 uncharacterized protein DUF2525 [Biostraticola tofi]
MGFAKEYSDNLQREINIDVDALLEAVQSATDSEVKRSQDNESRHTVTVGDKQYPSFGELASAYDLDIRDYAVTEVNR